MTGHGAMQDIVTLQIGTLELTVCLRFVKEHQHILYASPEEQEPNKILGRIDLYKAQLQRSQHEISIYERQRKGISPKRVKLKWSDREALDTWAKAIQQVISSNHRRKVPPCTELVKFSVLVTSSLRDERSDEMEFELMCQFVYSQESQNADATGTWTCAALDWKVWKSFAELQEIDDVLRTMLQSPNKRLCFPRDRRRDKLLLRGRRKKLTQELKEKQLTIYFQQLSALPAVTGDTQIVSILKQLLQFDAHFEETAALDATETGQMETVTAVHKRNLMEEPEDAYEDAEENNQISSMRMSSPLNRSEEIGAESLADKKKYANIIHLIKEHVFFDQERAEEFTFMMKNFECERISAAEIIAYLQGALGSTESSKLIPKLACLIQNDLKREELIHTRNVMWNRAFPHSQSLGRESKKLLDEKVVPLSLDSSVRKERPKSEKKISFAQSHQSALSRTPIARRRKSMFAQETKASYDSITLDENMIQEPQSRKHTESTITAPSSSQISTESPPNNGKNNRSMPNLFGEMDTDEELAITPPSQRTRLFSSSSEGSTSTIDVATGAEQLVPEAQDRRSEETVMTENDSGDSESNGVVKGTAIVKDAIRAAAVMDSIDASDGSMTQANVHVVELGRDRENHASKSRPPSIKDRYQQLHDQRKLQDQSEVDNPVLARLKKQGAVNFMAF